MVVGVYRTIALGERMPARALIVFGAIVFFTNASVWLARRQERGSSTRVRPLTIARAALPLAIALGVGAMICDGATGGLSLLGLVPAGVLMVVRGVLMLAYRDSVLHPLAEQEQSTFWGRAGMTREHPFGAVLLLIIGSGWALFGLLYGLHGV